MIAMAKNAAKTTLLLTSAEKSKKNISALLRSLLSDKNAAGVYVTINRSYKTLMNEFDPKISERLMFVDMVTEETGGEKKGSNCIYLHSPTSLTDLAITLDTAMNSIEAEEKFVIIDSVSALLIYNSPQVVEKFAHFIANKLRRWEAAGILVAFSKELDEKMKSVLSQFCDEVVEE